MVDRVGREMATMYTAIWKAFILTFTGVTLMIAGPAGANLAWEISGILRPATITTWGADAVSEDGSRIVGVAMVDTGQSGEEIKLFRWQDDGTVTLIPDPPSTPGAAFSLRGVSDDGTVIVGQEAPQIAWRWTATGGWLRLPDLPEGNGQTVVTRISADGQRALGTAYDDNPNEEDPSIKAPRSVLWTGSGVPAPLTNWFDDFEGSQSTGTYQETQRIAEAVAMDALGSRFVGSVVKYDEIWDRSYRRGVRIDGAGNDTEIAAPTHEPDTPLETGLGLLSPSGAVAFGGIEPRLSSSYPLKLIRSVGGSLQILADWPTGSSGVPLGLPLKDTTNSGNFLSMLTHVWSASGGFQLVSDFLAESRCLDTAPWDQMQLLAIASDDTTFIGNAVATDGSGTIWRSGLQTGPDDDEDGLLNEWEINGLDINGDGVVDLDLPTMGANPDRKDLFVEVDRMRNVPFSTDSLDLVVAAFEAAPVVNEDFSTGIDLHIDYATIDIVNRTAVADWTTFGEIKDGDDRDPGEFGTDAERADPNWPAIRCAREAVFRYGLFVDQLSDGEGGISEASGLAEGRWSNDFMLALSTLEDNLANSSPPEVLTDLLMGWVFMHELGHTLDLDEGGDDDVTYKPNYISVMNYGWPHMRKLSGVMLDLDYSREEIHPLNENALNEVQGIDTTMYRDVLSVHGYYDPQVFGQSSQFVFLNGSRHDWNGDGVASFDPTFTVSEDINRWTNFDAASPDELLQGFDDWANIRLELGTDGPFRSAVYGDVTTLFDPDVPADLTAELLSNPPTADLDRDGLSDFEEVAQGTDPVNPDTDGDGLCDGGPTGTAPECGLGGEDANGNGTYDPGLETDPNNHDTDGDGPTDGAEVAAGTDPLDSLDFPAPSVPALRIPLLWTLAAALAFAGLLTIRPRSFER
jgi:hypothetical protein